MKFRKHHIAAVLILCMVIPLGSALAVSGADGLSVLFTSGNQRALAAQVSLLGEAPEACVTWEIVTEGKTGETEDDTKNAVVRFTLENPGEETVSFDYTVLSGSADRGQHLNGALSGSVTLSSAAPTESITIEVKPLANNPEAHGTANNYNALWTGERVFYLFCSGIQNALFDGGRQSLTVPVPIASDFDYAVSYAAAASSLIDLDAVGGTDGVFDLASGNPLTLTGSIDGNVRKMLDAGVFTHILLPGGTLRNETDTEQTVLYQAFAYRNIEDPYGTAAHPPFPSIAVPANDERSFYAEDFTQSQPVARLNLGPGAEGNGIFSRLGFLWEGDGVSVRFADEAGQYERWQVRFSDKAAPTVKVVSIGEGRHYYDDQVPVTVTFSEPVHTDDITFQVGGTTCYPLEAPGTVSESVSFLHTVGDEALGASAVTVTVTEITGAEDLSGKAQESTGTGSASLNIGDFDVERALLYCAQPEATVDQGVSRTATVNISVPLKADTELRRWLADGSRLDGSVSKVFKARVVTESGAADVDLTVVPEDGDSTQAVRLTGSFTAPENATNAGIDYTLEFYLNTGDGFQLLRGLTSEYTIPPIVLIDEESDVTLTYTGWPASNRVFADAASSLSLGYTLNVDATWRQSTYFVWSSSNEAAATIDQSGVITVHGPGMVSFSLTVKSPVSPDTVTLCTPALTVLEATGAYLYVPDALSTPDVLKGSGAKVSFSTNITALNHAESPGAETTYTFTLYGADHPGGTPQRGERVWQDTQTATVTDPVTSCAVPAEVLQNATEKGVCGYILDITARDEKSGVDITATAYIRVRERPAKAVLTRPANLYLTDGAGSFSITAGAENATADTEYRLTVTRNSAAIFTDIAVTPGAVTAVPVRAVDASRLTDVYTVSLRVKNPDDPAWSADSFCVYVYRGGSMGFLVEGFPTNGLRVELQPSLEEGNVYDVSALRSRMSLGLSKSVSLDNRVGWSGAIDQITWSVSGESASLWHGQTRIRSGESLTLPPNASLQIVGDGAGTATVTATHAPTGMSVSNQVAVGGVDQLYLFQSAPKAHGRLVYTNGNGAEKDVPAFHGSAGVYEPSGIASDVVFYPEASTLYDFAVLTKNALDAGQKKASAFDLYPVHTLRISEVNHQVSLSLFDEATGDAYTGDITVRGGLYVNGEYYSHTKINNLRGDENQTATADSLGQYTLSFDVRDYYAFAVKSPSPSDELRYVIEVSFGTAYFPLYVTVENADIQAEKASSLGVSVSSGIKKVDDSMVQNKAIVLSQSVTLDGKELSLDDSLLKLDAFPSQALLNMTLLLPDYRDDHTAYYLHLEDGTGKGLGYAGRGEVEHPYPFSDIVTLRFSSDIRNPLYWMILYHLETGEKGYIYPSVERVPLGSGARSLYRLSKPVRVQSLVGVAHMDWSLLSDVSLVTLIESLAPGYQVPSFSTGIGLVDEALGIARGVSAYPYQKLIGLEISSTDDPLVYKGILRYAAGSGYFQDDSMHGGVYMREDDPASYSFLPSHRFTGEGKTAFMRRARSGNSTYYLSGGAYAECALRYNLSSETWELSIVKVDLDMRVSREYERRYNTYIGPVPVTAKFRTELSTAAGLTVLHAADGTKTAYIPRLSPAFAIYGSGGVGRDYKVVSLWAGPYGKAGMTQNYLWYRDSDGQTANGQRLSISGEVGVAFEIKLGYFWTVDGEYELTSYTNSWTYNDYNKITGLTSGGVLPPGRLFASEQVGLVPVSKTIRYADRTYLDRFERAWGEPSGRMGMLGLGGEGPATTLESNANPDSAPRLSDDGGLLAYLSDMDSTDLRDTAAVFSLRDGSGGYLPSEEISVSDYPDDALALSGTADGGVSAVWLRYFTDESGGTGGEPAMADVVNALASAEVMAAIYDPVLNEFTAARLTDNAAPEMSPVTAFAGGKAVAAWVGADFGDLENPLDFTSSRLMYSIYTGTGWTEAEILYDGSLAPATALSAAMMEDGTAAILYQVAGEAGDSDIFCAVLDASGTVLRTLRLTDNDTEDFNPQLVAVQFPDGTVRFVAGWNQVDESGRLSIRLAAVNADGTPYPALSLQLSEDGSLRDYDGFLLSKGAETLEQLSVLWGEAEDGDGDGVYEYALYGAKPVEISEGMFSLSGGAQLLELPERTALRSLDARTDSMTGELQLVMVTQATSGEATMSAATLTYQAAVSVAQPQFLYADLIPGLELPVSFTVRNDGMAPITKIDLVVGGSTFPYEDLNLLPGDSETFTVLYPVPETVADAAYTVTASFGSAGGTATAAGTLKLNLPDVGIAQIDATKQIGRERGFRVLLENSGYAPLVPGTHSVRLEAWDDPNFNELDSGKTPLWSKLISGADVTALSGSPLPVNVTLNAAALAPLLIDGEIPDGGAWVYFRVVLLENGMDTQDAESGNDLDYVQIYSLIEQYGKKVSLSSALEIESGAATLRVNAANNAMQALTNGGIVATLRDAAGNALETQRTTNPLNIAGESSGTADLTFTATGHSVDVTFVTTATGGARLSALNLTGVPLEFDPGVYDYTIQTYDLSAATLTAVAEDPAAALTVKRNGTEISAAGPLSLPYGETVFTVTVIASGGAAQATYTVRIQNSSTQNTPGPVGPGSESQSAELKIGGVSRSGLRVRIRGGQASVALGELAREIFDGRAGATLTMPALSGLDRYLLELPADALSGEDSGASLTFDTPIARISLPAGMLGGMTELAGKTAGITIAKADETALSDMARAAVGNRPLLSLTLTLDGVQAGWSNPDAPVTVSIPYVPTAEERESPESIVIWYIDGSGSLHCVTNGCYKPETGTVTFETTHFSLYAVGCNPVEFDDVASAAWYADAVRYLAARGITSGTTATTFSPDAALTRGQFITLLLRAYGIEAAHQPTDNFSDAGNTYYTGYLAAAKQLGISNGVGGNNFAPEAAITRQEMITLLYNALSVLEKLPDGDSGKTLPDFTDRESIAAYAREAMAYLVEAGAVSGSNGYLLPEATATRAQVAQVLYNLLRQ